MEIKNIITEKIMQLEREGKEKLITALEEIGFFIKPASINHHSNEDKGLAIHSLEVMKNFKMLNERYNTNIPEDSIIISGLLHDVDKALNYTKEMQVTITSGQKSYLDTLFDQHYNTVIGNDLLKYKQNDFQISKEYASDLISWLKDGGYDEPPEPVADWVRNKKSTPLNHPVHGLIFLAGLISLEEREILAIRYHMGAYEEGLVGFKKKNIYTAENMYPDVRLLQLADQMATVDEDFMKEFHTTEENV
ncbi:MAG: HD domain-containing protein [Halanaerobiales bacterium]